MKEYIYIIKILLNKRYYNKYYRYINLSYIKKNISLELYKIYYSLKVLHESSTTEIFSTDDLILQHLTLYPPSLDDVSATLFQKVADSAPDEGAVTNYLNSLMSYEIAASVMDASQAVLEGRGDLSKVRELLSRDEEIDVVSQHTLGLSILNEENIDYGKGITWPIVSLNRSIGPLRSGNFGIVFARPETGKTTFIAQCLGCWATQCERPLLLFNNEQPNKEVELRIVQSFFGITTKQLLANAKYYFEKFIEATGNRITVVDAVSFSTREIEKWLVEVNPEVIVFDQLDKVHGFKSDEQRKDLEYKAIYQWARELSKRFGPTIGICQAGATGEGKRYLDMDDMDGSKTAKQGEADWILGIGCERGSSRDIVRGLSICKNKLPGDEHTLPALRHGKFDVLIDPEKGQYCDTEI